MQHAVVDAVGVLLLQRVALVAGVRSVSANHQLQAPPRNSPPIASALPGLVESEKARAWREGFHQVECDLTCLCFSLKCSATTWLTSAYASSIDAPPDIARCAALIVARAATEWVMTSEFEVGGQLTSLRARILAHKGLTPSPIASTSSFWLCLRC